MTLEHTASNDEQSRSIDTTRNPLRVGLLLNEPTVPKWMFDSLVSVVQAGLATIELGVIRKPDAAQALRSRRGGLKTALYGVYSKLDNALHRESNAIFAPRHIAPLLSNDRLLEVAPRTTAFRDYVNESDLALIRQHDLDVLVRVGFRILSGDILTSAKYGVWSYHHGSVEHNRGGPPGFWEVMTGAPFSGAVLQVLSEALDGGRVLVRGYTQTVRSSVAKNREAVYRRASEFLPYALRCLRQSGSLPSPSSEAAAAWEPYSHPLYTAPGNAHMARLLIGRGALRVRTFVHRLLFTERWEIAVHVAPSLPPAHPPEPALYRYRPLLAPRGTFWADPHVERVGGRTCIFFEEYQYSKKKAHIAVLVGESAQTWRRPEIALDLPTHLSNPFVFRWNGSLYMVPESRATRSVDLYKCSGGPTSWSFARRLIDNVEATDVTIAEIDRRWWMWVAVATAGTSTNDRLCLFMADHPLGPWNEHPQSPIKFDVRSSRPAGRVFEYQGHRYRPAQDCSTGYGDAIVLNRIDRLTPDDYSEVSVGRIAPEWHKALVGMHTMGAGYGVSAIDVRRRIPRFWPARS